MRLLPPSVSGVLAVAVSSLPVASPRLCQHLALRRMCSGMGVPRPPRMVATAPPPPPPSDFEALGMAPQLLPTLASAGITEPTEVQRAAFGAILDGGDSVLLSETGSGKTLAYALPILHRLISKVDHEQADGVSPEGSYSESDGSVAAHCASRSQQLDDQVLVLVPNRDLCSQVHDVFQGLIKSLPDELHRRLSVSSLVSEVYADIDSTILIATPAVALRMWRGPESVRTVVLDEADALLAGSFKPAARATYPIEILIAAVKRSAKEEAMAAAAASGPQVRTVPRTQHGAEARALRARAFASKQFLLVGATMPNAGTKNTEEHVRRLFPLATWHRASQVHRNKREIAHYFVRIDEASRGEALRQALRHGPTGRTLIFANTVDMAREALEEACIEVSPTEVALFHAEQPISERATQLAAFADGRLRALVCTGLASRGIDFVNVAHVIQYDVASNAVEFMHRVGRTARAGKPGVSTTLYAADRAELVEGLRDALTSGAPIEHLFSRKRSFKLKIKKRRKLEAAAEVEDEGGVGHK